MEFITFNEDFVNEVRSQFPDVEVIYCDFMELGQTHGYHFIFQNGMSASVQFGPCTYSTHHDRTMDFSFAARDMPVPITYAENAMTAEIAGWPNDKNETWADFGWDDDVLGYQSPQDVLAWLDKVAAIE